jgi:hypothetical protein
VLKAKAERERWEKVEGREDGKEKEGEAEKRISERRASKRWSVCVKVSKVSRWKGLSKPVRPNVPAPSTRTSTSPTYANFYLQTNLKTAKHFIA